MKTPPPLPEAKTHRRSKVGTIFKWIGIGILALIGSVILLAIVLAAWPDSSPPDDSAMLPIFDAASPENPLAKFQAWVEANPVNEDDDRLGMLRDEDSWDPEAADELLKESEEALRRFDELLTSDISTWRWREGDTVASFAAPIPYIQSLMAVSKLVAIRSLRSSEKGHSDEGIESAVQLLRFGGGLQNAQGSLIHLLVGETVSAMGIRYLEESSVANDMSIDQLNRITTILGNLEPEIANLRFALKTEYLSFKRMIDDLLAGRLENGGMHRLETIRISLPYLQRNDTLRLYLELTILVDEALGHGWSEVSQAHAVQEEKLLKLRTNPARLFVSPNPIGKILLSIALPAYQPIAAKVFEEQARHRQMLAMLAMRRYELDHERLPATLDNLVPEYLSAIPEDPFTGLPMPWDSAKQVIYSLGRDLVDDGGDVGEKGLRRKRGSDVGMNYWWAKSGSAESKD